MVDTAERPFTRAPYVYMRTGIAARTHPGTHVQTHTGTCRTSVHWPTVAVAVAVAADGAGGDTLRAQRAHARSKIHTNEPGKFFAFFATRALTPGHPGIYY